MTKKEYIDKDGNVVERPTSITLPSGEKLTSFTDETLYAVTGIKAVEVVIPPTPEEEKQARINELTSWINLGYAYWVSQYVREKYDLDAELAIQRQRETKAEDFNTYFTYCEECKTKAQENIAAWEKELEELQPVTNVEAEATEA